MAIIYYYTDAEHAWTVSPVVELRREDDDESLPKTFLSILARFSAAAVNVICMISADRVSNVLRLKILLLPAGCIVPITRRILYYTQAYCNT